MFKGKNKKFGCFGVFIVNFEHISHLFLVFLFLDIITDVQKFRLNARNVFLID